MELTAEFYVALSFILLILGVYVSPFWKKGLSGLDSKLEEIASDLVEAENLQEHSWDIYNKRLEFVEECRRRSEEMKEEAHREREKLKGYRMEVLKGELKRSKLRVRLESESLEKEKVRDLEERVRRLAFASVYEVLETSFGEKEKHLYMERVFRSWST